jgi:hypothetical protein
LTRRIALLAAQADSEFYLARGGGKVVGRLVEQSGTVLPGSAAEFGRLIAEETEKWGKVVKFAGLKPE